MLILAIKDKLHLENCEQSNFGSTNSPSSRSNLVKNRISHSLLPASLNNTPRVKISRPERHTIKHTSFHPSTHTDTVLGQSIIFCYNKRTPITFNSPCLVVELIEKRGTCMTKSVMIVIMKIKQQKCIIEQIPLCL